MATPEEIKNRVDEFDSARSSRRKAAAHKVSELAVRHDELASEVDEVKRTLAEVLAEYSDVITVEELARFTEVPEARGDLVQGQVRDLLRAARPRRQVRRDLLPGVHTIGRAFRERAARRDGLQPIRPVHRRSSRGDQEAERGQ